MLFSYVTYGKKNFFLFCKEIYGTAEKVKYIARRIRIYPRVYSTRQVYALRGISGKRASTCDFVVFRINIRFKSPPKILQKYLKPTQGICFGCG